MGIENFMFAKNVEFGLLPTPDFRLPAKS